MAHWEGSLCFCFSRAVQGGRVQQGLPARLSLLGSESGRACAVGLETLDLVLNMERCSHDSGMLEGRGGCGSQRSSHRFF